MIWISKLVWSKQSKICLLKRWVLVNFIELTMSCNFSNVLCYASYASNEMRETRELHIICKATQFWHHLHNLTWNELLLLSFLLPLTFEEEWLKTHCSKSLFFVQKIQLWFPEKIVDFFGWKTRENVVVLDFLAVDNFDFTRKIVKKKFGWKTRENASVLDFFLAKKLSKLNFWTKIWPFRIVWNNKNPKCSSVTILKSHQFVNVAHRQLNGFHTCSSKEFGRCDGRIFFFFCDSFLPIWLIYGTHARGPHLLLFDILCMSAYYSKIGNEHTILTTFARCSRTDF